MAKGSYNISVAGDSNFESGGNINSDEGELGSQECMNSCLSPVFLRSLSFHDRPRSSRVPINKEFRCTRYKALVSSSLEKIPSNLLLPSEKKSKSDIYHCSESVGSTTQSPIFNEFSSAASQQTQNTISGDDSWLEDRYMRFGAESEKLLEKTISILRALDKDISESLINLTRPESIALESVIEIYRNKVNKRSDCSVVSELDLSSEISSRNVGENAEPSVELRPKDVQTHFTPQRPKDLPAERFRQSPKTLQSASPRQSPKTLQSASPRQSPKTLQSASPRQSPKTLQSVSHRQNPENFQAQSSRESPKNLQSPKKNLLAQCSRQSPKHFPAESPQQIPKHLHTNATLYSPKHLLRSDEESSKNVSSSPKRIAPDDAADVKYPFEFDLPSDHEQFVKIIGALQNRCLEYREMIQDIAISALEECLNFSEFSTSRIRHLRKQFESQKRNFKDFKELCCKSVVFGPDSLPIDNKVTEVIQSFYLKLLQEENETFMARLEFSLKMGEVYAKILKYETESKKIITTLEKEILYLKKTSIGFKV
ncbi:Myosin light chain kinase like protein [Argiope bruennichi]|uniref:Myosin light chain kinase like protein n=1 Tax=Argiope bruennichi TaxID=94029 RepID=A0A8T0EBY1_ARGBR|nr:Myosin light chain kinase like protein [Argiope bruennichi]